MVIRCTLFSKRSVSVHKTDEIRVGYQVCPLHQSHSALYHLFPSLSLPKPREPWIVRRYSVPSTATSLLQPAVLVNQICTPRHVSPAKAARRDNARSPFLSQVRVSLTRRHKKSTSFESFFKSRQQVVSAGAFPLYSLSNVTSTCSWFGCGSGVFACFDPFRHVRCAENETQ